GNRTILVSGGAGGRTDPSQIAVSDLALVGGDALLAKLRTRLRKDFGFPAGANDPKRTQLFGIPAVYSREKGRPCADDAAAEAGVNAGFGTAMVVTASVGLRLASEVIRRLVG
ncbi:MAG: tRNA threonylcarbamoyladenosine dehydratase, partial [Duodenibacillus sp.]